MARSGKLGNGGKRHQQGLIEVLESRRLLSTWVTLSGPTGGSGPQGAPVEGNTLTYTVTYFWDSAGAPGGTVHGGTATAGQDYEILTSAVTIPSNPNYYPTGGTMSFTVPVKSDNLIEDPETLIVRIGSSSPDIQVRPYGFPDYLDPTPYIQSTVSIVDDPPVVSLGVADPYATENAAGEPADPGMGLRCETNRPGRF